MSDVIENDNGTYMKVFVYGFDSYSPFLGLNFSSDEIQDPYANIYTSYAGWFYDAKETRLAFPGDGDKQMPQYAEPDVIIDSNGNKEQIETFDSTAINKYIGNTSVDRNQWRAAAVGASDSLGSILSILTEDADHISQIVNICNENLDNLLNYSVSFSDSGLLNVSN